MEHPSTNQHAQAIKSETEFPGLNVLIVNASSRTQDSVTKHLTGKLVEEIGRQYTVNQLMVRDLAVEPLPVISESWVEANFTDPAQRNKQQHSILAQSDRLVDEIKEADVIVLGVPIYNFSVPAAMKAWIDLVARAGLTFRYTSEGPVGLLTGKHAVAAIASGGVAIDSAVDFATPYLRHVLGFIGIDDVSIVKAERLNVDSDAGKEVAERQITKVVSDLNHLYRKVA